MRRLVLTAVLMAVAASPAQALTTTQANRAIARKASQRYGDLMGARVTGHCRRYGSLFDCSYRSPGSGYDCGLYGGQSLSECYWKGFGTVRSSGYATVSKPKYHAPDYY